MVKQGEEQALIEGMMKTMNELSLSSHDEVFRVNIGGKVFHIPSSLLSIKEDEMLTKIFITSVSSWLTRGSGGGTTG